MFAEHVCRRSQQLLLLCTVASACATTLPTPTPLPRPEAAATNERDSIAIDEGTTTDAIDSEAMREVRAWLAESTTHALAVVTRLDEHALGPSGHVDESEERVRLVATDGSVVLDAWIDLDRPLDVDAMWNVQRLVDRARANRLDALFFDWSGTSLSTVDGRSYVCDAERRACSSLPTPLRVKSFSCDEDGSACELAAEYSDGVEDTWSIAFTARGIRRRLASTRDVGSRPLEPPFVARPRRTVGRWQSLEREATRPAWLDDPVFDSRLNDAVTVWAEQVPCVPTIASVRDATSVVRAISCRIPDGSDDPASIPVAFVLTRGDETTTTPVFGPSIGTPEPTRIRDAAAFPSGAFAFDAREYGGSSPSGDSSSTLWVVLPASATRPIAAHALSFEHWSTEGEGEEDEREGYVVSLEVNRLDVALEGTNAPHLTACAYWGGIHARISDRWTGHGATVALNAPLAFDERRGFDLDAIAAIRDARGCEAP